MKSITLITVYGSFHGFKLDRHADRLILFAIESAGDYNVVRLHPFFDHEIAGIIESDVSVSVTRL